MSEENFGYDYEDICVSCYENLEHPEGFELNSFPSIEFLHLAYQHEIYVKCDCCQKVCFNFHADCPKCKNIYENYYPGAKEEADLIGAISEGNPYWDAMKNDYCKEHMGFYHNYNQ